MCRDLRTGAPTQPQAAAAGAAGGCERRETTTVGLGNVAFCKLGIIISPITLILNERTDDGRTDGGIALGDKSMMPRSCIIIPFSARCYPTQSRALNKRRCILRRADDRETRPGRGSRRETSAYAYIPHLDICLQYGDASVVTAGTQTPMSGEWEWYLSDLSLGRCGIGLRLVFVSIRRYRPPRPSSSGRP